MALTQKEIDDLRIYYVAKTGDNAIKGHLLPQVTDIYNLGSTSQRFNVVYAKSVIADSITGGSGGGNADSVDGFSASQDPIANTLLALDGSANFPVSVYPRALLDDGTRTHLYGNLTANAGVLIDTLDISEHDHSDEVGTPGIKGKRLNHQLLLNLDADDHPQYTQWGANEAITGNWKFVPNVDDITQGWIIEPDTFLIRAQSNNIFITGAPTLAEISLGVADNIVLSDDGAVTKISLGSGNNLIYLSPNHATHRMWVGDSSPTLAEFQIKNDGTLQAGNWEISNTHIKNDKIELLPTGAAIIGPGAAGGVDDLIHLSTLDNTYRFWIGNTDPGAAPFTVDRFGNMKFIDAQVGGRITSANYVSGSAGWSLQSNGRLEANNLVARGRIEAVVYAEKTVSAMAGTLILTAAGVLQQALDTTATSIFIDNDAFAISDVLYIKPSGTREEWMKVSGVNPNNPVNLGTAEKPLYAYEYIVIRGLDGVTASFNVGETILRKGTAIQAQPMYPMGAGNENAEYGVYMPGGSGSASFGGWLVLDGSTDTGPFFGVVKRETSVYNAVVDVVRIGNISGIGHLGFTSETYGVYIGDDANYFTYANSKLTIKTRDGSTQINELGVTTDSFLLTQTVDTPAPAGGQTQVQAKSDGHLYITPFGGSSKRIMTADLYDANLDGVVDNALKANGFSVSSTPVANNILPLDASAYVPSAALGYAVLKTGSAMTGALSTTSALTAYNGGNGQVAIGSDYIEVGKLARGAASTPYIDFHSSLNSPDYDVRLLATGGSATAGQGSLNIKADSLYLNTNEKISGAGGVTIIIDGAGSVPSLGWKGDLVVPYKCYVYAWDITSDATGSCAVGFYKYTAAAYPTTYTQMGTATLSSARKASGNAGVPLTLEQGDVLSFYVGSASTLTRIHVTLRLNKVT